MVISRFQPDFLHVRDSTDVEENSEATYLKSLEDEGIFAIDVYEVVGPGR